MNVNLPNVIPIIPEIFMTIMVCIILISGVFRPQRKFSFYLAQCTLVVTAVLVAVVFFKWDQAQDLVVWDGSFVLDRLAVILKIFILLSVFFTFIYSWGYNLDRRIAITEFYALGLLSTIGMLVLVSAHSLITIFLGVELLSLPTYAMVAMRRDEERCIEAAMKYFIIGALATGMLLYGFSMLFGASRSLDIAEVAKNLAASSMTHNYVAIFGLVFAIAGLAFKLGAAPFHMWVPDVYDGAPTSVTLFIATAPKIAGFGMAIRLLVGTIPELHFQWQEMLMVLALLSMGIGNFAAIVQSNIKRMLAYSSIAHIGYMLLGLICATSRGYAAALFYVISYSIMTLAGFGMLAVLSRAGFEAEDIDDLKALNNRHPWLAFMMLIVMFSLAGVPPLVGFIAKIGLLEALIDVHLVWLAVLAILFAIIGAYYYLRVVKVMYFETLETESTIGKLTVSKGALVAISINGVAVLLLGIFPGALFTLCHAAFQMLI